MISKLSIAYLFCKKKADLSDKHPFANRVLSYRVAKAQPGLRVLFNSNTNQILLVAPAFTAAKMDPVEALRYE